MLIATGEDDLRGALGALPASVKSRTLLIQNELRPDQWEEHNLDPTVGIIWFEKKKGRLPSVVLPTVLYGKHATLLDQALDKLELAHRTVDSQNDLAHELVLKNLYILGLNLTGLRVGGVASELLGKNAELFGAVLDELLPLESALLRSAPSFSAIKLDESRLREDLKGAILADPDHGCSGRSAPRRLQRTLAHAARLKMKTPLLSQLAQEAK